MKNGGLLVAAIGIAVMAAGSLTTSRANAMPNGLPAAAADQIDITEAVALCFYIDGWNGPGMYQCGYRMRRGHGWHGHRSGGRHGVHGGGHHRGGSHHRSGGRHGGGGGRHGGGKSRH